LPYLFKDAPPSNVVKNDYLLDRWVDEQQIEKRKERASGLGGSKKGPKNKRNTPLAEDFNSTAIKQ
jgi:hypothetical protein